jgi:hypothetical protein
MNIQQGTGARQPRKAVRKYLAMICFGASHPANTLRTPLHKLTPMNPALPV